ncbi:PREDICTED: alpha-1,3-mannosyl-glycoprotein 2-beta-N-acetylglucosaminyltransferase [Rhagoletis zephyria]|uniref:alpha-1,3-mannosyl-glycoprotein 2-beta-N-acetylglucosaminyltransferase n=1 Tax=Rhagoletis zephyria TaxID=28612 RepID=UPI00081132C1|nr:PREDICTED: alpha-1,3-mannosyl-glycoprotein 2-beta-N-acetylglucosaminyltransferase [Rhagoletis zephyria]XP_036330238.1 alpha-1,3-mannosyl-glycoprotein 2-beta-N-acetylglucosaminyltransferase [Rhagoletis pomonella]
MRSRKILIIAGFLTTWTFITYYFLIRNSTMYPSRDRLLLKKINKLERESHAENKENSRLVGQLIGIIKEKIIANDVEESLPSKQTKDRPIGIVALSPDHLLGLQEPGQVNSHEDNPPEDEIGDSGKDPPIVKPIMTHMPNGDPVIPILVIACNRVSIRKCLDNLVQYRPNADQFPIIVSQDCGDQQTKKAILSYESQVTLIEQPDLSDILTPPREKKFKGYYKIARHYGWALNTTFQKGYEYVVIVEDDLNVAPDFYEYFLGTHTLLKQDPSLWCVSAWNDNGKDKFVDNSKPEVLYRTDFFPGLGWMLTRNLWQELSVKWPKSFWDDWIRHPEQRKERACIRPEISRTRTFGKIGVSNGLFFDKYLKYIKLSEHFVNFSKMNLSYLLRENYDRTFLNDVYSYPIVTYEELRRNLIKTDGPVRIQYTTREQYKHITSILGLMGDFKSGVPRTAYHGIVSFFFQKRRVYLAPNANWKGYDLSWS